MATFTITGLDTRLDSLVGRTGGDVYNINGGELVIDTDTRWCDGAPASMVGSMGTTTISSSLGGRYVLDATKVRWLSYDTGSGTVPAIATSITQGGVTGELLGVWADMTSAPTAVGASMPSTGYIKFREVTGGSFSAGSLTGIGANATAADVTGWIEVVHDLYSQIVIPRLGKFETRGDWFYLSDTSGSANQQLQIPTNGSATTYVPGVWIETSSGSNDYEFYPAIPAALMITANLGTDVRSKFVLMETNGNVRIGHNGSTTVGYVPPSGCKVRLPNILGRQCATGTRQTNAIPNATFEDRPSFVTSGGGSIDIEHLAADWYMSFFPVYSVKMHHVAFFDAVRVASSAAAVDLNDGGNGLSQSVSALYRPLAITGCFAGGTIQNWSCSRYSAGSQTYILECSLSNDLVISNLKSGLVTYTRSTGTPTGGGIYINLSSRITINDCKTINQGLGISNSENITVNDYDYNDRYVGATNTTHGIYCIRIEAGSDNILVDGLTFGFGGVVANTHPYLGLFYASQSSNITIRNAGSRTSFLSGGSSNNPQYIFVSASYNNNVKIQRCYITPLRTAIFSDSNLSNIATYEHVYGDFADTVTLKTSNSVLKNCGGTNTTTGQNSVYGTHFFDTFISDTEGKVVLALNEPTATTSSLVSYVSGSPSFNSSGSLVMTTLGDEVIIESSYFVKGCTALPATAPVVTGTNVTYSSGATWGNHEIYYQIDNGSGYGGVWKDFNATNLSGETVDPGIGFKLKYRIITSTAATDNLITYISLSTTSTLVAQTNNLYPLDTVTAKVTVLDSDTGAPIEDARVLLKEDPSGVEIISGLTDVNGEISTSYELTTLTQDVTGRARRATVGLGSLYKSSPILGTITSDGLDLIVFLTPD